MDPKEKLLKELQERRDVLIQSLETLEFPPDRKEGLDKLLGLMDVTEANINPALAMTATISIDIYLTVVLAELGIAASKDKVIRTAISDLVAALIRDISDVSLKYRDLMKSAVREGYK